MQRLDRRSFLRAMNRCAMLAALPRALPALALQDAAATPAGKPVPLDPIPENELHLPHITAEPWLRVDERNLVLKGIAFDRENNLTVLASYPAANNLGLAGRLDRALLRITPKKQISTLYRKQGLRLCDHAIHKDGRIFIACLTGELVVLQPDGSNPTLITSRADGRPKALSDLTFGSDGSLYITDFTGKPGDPTGGVYRWTPDFASVELFGPKLVSPNGIAFSPGERALWVSCSFDKKLIHLNLSSDRKTVVSTKTAYDLNGPGGDGIRVDVKGNVYLGLNFQGRFMVFNPEGKPIATVPLPNRERGELLNSSNLAFKPGTDEVYAVASGDVGGTWIYRFRGLAQGLPLYSHQ